MSLLLKGHPINSLAFWQSWYIAGLSGGTAGKQVHWWGYLHIVLIVYKPFCSPITQLLEALHYSRCQISSMFVLTTPDCGYVFYLRRTLDRFWSSLLMGGQGRLWVLSKFWCLLEPTCIREVIFMPVKLTIRIWRYHEIFFGTSAKVFRVVHIYFCTWGNTCTAW